ncbi:MAG: tetratricopeptide repeat protein [Bacteroidales bacterium]|nr:tetratricopeptide repeat protein [Bacteroidales bacterium]
MRKFTICIFLFLSLGAAAQNDGRLKAAVDNALTDIVSSLYDKSPEASLKALEDLKKYTPDNDALYYYSGMCRYALNDREGACAEFEKAVALDSSNHWYLSALADFYSETGQTRKGAELYVRLLKEAPGIYRNSVTLTRLGDLDFYAGRDSSARELYRQALQMDPDYIPAVMGMSELYRTEGNLPAYMASIRKMTSSEAVSTRFKVDYLNNMFKYVDGRFFSVWGAQLDSMVTDVVNLSPSDTAALRFAGSWYYGTDRKQEGIRYFDKLALLCPDNQDALILQAELAYVEKDYPRMFGICGKILKLKNARPELKLNVLGMMGDAYAGTDDYDAAFKCYEKALRIDPEYVYVLNNYAYFLSLKGKKLKKAASMSKITVDAAPDNATYLDTYGWILFLQGKYSQAKLQFKRAMIYGGKDSKVILEHYSEVLKALGENDLADHYRSLAEQRKDEN